MYNKCEGYSHSYSNPVLSTQSYTYPQMETYLAHSYKPWSMFI